jgi:hypothetical protein
VPGGTPPAQGRELKRVSTAENRRLARHVGESFVKTTHTLDDHPGILVTTPAVFPHSEAFC